VILQFYQASFLHFLAIFVGIKNQDKAVFQSSYFTLIFVNRLWK